MQKALDEEDARKKRAIVAQNGDREEEPETRMTSNQTMSPQMRKTKKELVMSM